MQPMDLRNTNLDYGQKAAIQPLGYGASCKIGMKFCSPQRITKFSINQGDLEHYHMLTRHSANLSYNIYDDPRGSVVLLCCYEWQQDAQRIATFVSCIPQNRANKDAKENELVLWDLVLLHVIHPSKPMSPQAVYDMIKIALHRSLRSRLVS